MGSATDSSIFNFLSDQFTFSERGGIIVVEIKITDYSLSEISRIVESEGFMITGSYMSILDDKSHLLLTFKVNTFDLVRILSTMERFGYKIKASFNEEGYFDVLKDRYDSLMSFLNV